MITANSSVLQIGKETTYSIAATPSKIVGFISADFKPTVNKKDDGLLTGKSIGSSKETMSVKTSGSISTLAKPETIGIFLKGSFGVESLGEQNTTTKKYPHTFTLIGNEESDYLPSYTVVLDKKATVNSYNGLVVDSLALSASAEDYLKADISFIGYDESAGTLATSLSKETVKALKFRQGKVYLNNSEIANVTSIKFELKNNTSSLQTTSTNLHFTQPKQGVREITSEIEIVYSSSTETIRKNYFKDSDDTFSIKLNFTDDSNNSLTLTIPAAQVSACDPPAMSGTDTLKQTVSILAVASDNEPVTAELDNDKSEEY